MLRAHVAHLSPGSSRHIVVPGLQYCRHKWVTAACAGWCRRGLLLYCTSCSDSFVTAALHAGTTVLPFSSVGCRECRAWWLHVSWHTWCVAVLALLGSAHPTVHALCSTRGLQYSCAALQPC
jgi:hypothetical protein